MTLSRGVIFSVTELINLKLKLKITKWQKVLSGIDVSHIVKELEVFLFNIGQFLVGDVDGANITGVVNTTVFQLEQQIQNKSDIGNLENFEIFLSQINPPTH